MPAFVPTKPASGADIATVWGVDVHNRVYTPLGEMAGGTDTTGITAQTVLNMSTHSFGDAEFLDAPNNRQVIPVGGSGLYMMICSVSIRVTSSWVRVAMRRSGTIVGGHSVRGHATLTGYATIGPFIYSLSDGQYIDWVAQADTADPADVQITRATVLRLGNTVATSVAAMFADVPPEPEALPFPLAPDDLPTESK